MKTQLANCHVVPQGEYYTFFSMKVDSKLMNKTNFIYQQGTFTPILRTLEVCIKILKEFRQNHTSTYKTSFIYVTVYRCICVCVVEHIILTSRKLIKRKAFGVGSNLERTFNMLVVLYEEISNVSHVLQMLKNGLKMSFCLPEPYNYFKNIFLQQHQYLFLYVIFAVWMLDLSFHIAVKERSEKTKTLNKSNNRIWFQDYFPWLKLFLSESFFLE